MRYLLFQVPGLLLLIVVLAVLRTTIGLSLELAAAILAISIAIDLALFPFVRRAYEIDGRTPVERLVGERGTAMQDLAPVGYVRVRGELWRAEALTGGEPIPAGRAVIIGGARDLTLLVSADAEAYGPGRRADGPTKAGRGRVFTL